MKDKRLVSLFMPLKIEGDQIFIFLQKRSKDAKWLPDHFGFWGGGCEGSETPIEGLIREVKEELGVEIDDNSVTIFNQYEFLGSIKYAFLYKPEPGWENELNFPEGDFGKWFSSEEAMKQEDIILEDKVILNDLERKLLNLPIR